MRKAGDAAWLIRSVWAAAIGLSPLVALAAGLPDPNQPEQAKTILADRIREQGHPCEQAVKAYRDEARSKPDEPEWILVCSDASYRIRLRADLPAEVEKLKNAP